MKKLLGLGLALFCLASCGSDDDTPAVNMEHLDHRWYPVSTKFGEATQPYEGHESCGKDYTEFQANNVMREVDVTDCQSDPTITTGTYAVGDKTLTTTIDGETITYTIKKLNATNFEIVTSFNGAEITYVYTSNP